MVYRHNVDCGNCEHCKKLVEKWPDGVWRHMLSGRIKCDPTEPEVAKPRKLPAFWKKYGG